MTDMILLKDMDGSVIDVITKEKNEVSYQLIKTKDHSYLLNLEKKTMGKVIEKSDNNYQFQKWDYISEGRTMGKIITLFNNGMLIPGKKASFKIAGPKAGEIFEMDTIKECKLLLV